MAKSVIKPIIQPVKRLILRLSSLGDVILATSALETNLLGEGQTHCQTDWVTGAEYAPLLRGHPRITKLWEFDRRLGFWGWWELSRLLWQKKYDEVYDLHRSLRTRLLRLYFIFWGLKEWTTLPRWKVIQKQYLRRIFYFIFKKYFPRRFRPQPMRRQFAKAVGGSGDEKTDLSHLLKISTPVDILKEFSIETRPTYFCVMPSSRWSAKQWGTEKYFQAIQSLGIFPVILGNDSDFESHRLVELLKYHWIPHLSGVGKWDLIQVAQVLSGSKEYFGNDTGLAHLAEALGKKAYVLFGPTTPDLGFGPWRAESLAMGADLWCRPCGKDGRTCHRIFARYACMKELSVDQVVGKIRQSQ